MTFSKLIARLLAFGPPVIVPNTRVPNHCVLATAVALDVLRLCDEEAEPLACRVVVANAHASRAVERGVSVVVAIATGGHVLDTGAASTVDGMWWRGHLMAYLPQRRRLLDLNHSALSRPAHGLEMEPAVCLPFWPPDGMYRTRTGERLEVVARPDDLAWRAAPDWTEASRRRAMVAQLLRAVKTGRL